MNQHLDPLLPLLRLPLVIFPPNTHDSDGCPLEIELDAIVDLLAFAMDEHERLAGLIERLE